MDALYQKLFNTYKSAYPYKKTSEVQNEAVAFWNSIKTSSEFDVLLEEKLKELSNRKMKAQTNLLSFWTKTLSEPTSAPNNEKEQSATGILEPSIVSGLPSANAVVIDTSKTKREAPAQEKLNQKVQLLKKEIELLRSRSVMGMSTENEINLVKQKTKELEEAEKTLKKRQQCAQRNVKYRLEKKKALDALCSEIPDMKKKIKLHDKVGRPRIEEDQPDLLRVIIEICTHGAAAHGRRRSEIINTVKSLDDLRDILNNEYGFVVSRSATYLRLLPRKSNSIEGKKHVVTVPVKLSKPQIDCHKSHIDAAFACATINNLEEIASLLGPNEVSFLSQDDKARVPIGITAANKQSPLLMHVDYRIRLPDHDWVVALSHKLIPRSSIFNILKDRFMPPPVPIIQTSKGLDVNSSGKFPALFVLRSLDGSAILNKLNCFKITPYDLFCTSVKETIKKRICSKCGLYFACLKKLKTRFRNCGIKADFKIRPVRIAAIRQKEFLAVVKSSEDEEAAWLDEDILDLTDLAIEGNKIDLMAPHITIEKHLESIWEQQE